MQKAYRNVKWSNHKCNLRIMAPLYAESRITTDTLCEKMWLHNRVVYTLHIPVHREESFSKKAKQIIMAQYENGIRKDSFVNRTQ